MTHPTYSIYGKYAGTIQARCKEAKLPDAWSEEGLQLREEFAAEHGRCWQVFDFYDSINSYKIRPWIEQFKK